MSNAAAAERHANAFMHALTSVFSADRAAAWEVAADAAEEEGDLVAAEAYRRSAREGGAW